MKALPGTKIKEQNIDTTIKKNALDNSILTCSQPRVPRYRRTYPCACACDLLIF